MVPTTSGGNRRAPFLSRSPVAAPREQAHAGGRSRSGSGTMRVRAVLLAAALVLSPLSARAADLVVWWERGFHPDEDQALRETIAAFEQKTGKKVELAFYAQQIELPGRTAAAVEVGHPPDLVYGLDVALTYFARWAHEDRLVDLAGALGALAAQFDKDALDRGPLLDATARERGLSALPMGRGPDHLHHPESRLVLGQLAV